MKIIDCIQGTEEWHQARLGIPTASNFDKIVTSKGDPSKQAQKYLYRLAGESITGCPEETYQNATMLRGIEMESEARSLYEVVTDETVSEVGFCLSDDGKHGASPDGLVGDNGTIEIKCPNLATHVEYLLDGGLPKTYFQQVQGQLFVAEREWADFVSYYPAMNPLIVRVERDDKFLKALENELNEFCEKLAEVIKKIK